MFPIQLRSVLGGMEIKKHRRWRRPLAVLLSLMREQMIRFLQSKGSCSHFSRLPIDLQQATIDLIKQIGIYNDQYREWIKANEKNSERFLREA